MNSPIAAFPVGASLASSWKHSCSPCSIWAISSGFFPGTPAKNDRKKKYIYIYFRAWLKTAERQSQAWLFTYYLHLYPTYFQGFFFCYYWKKDFNFFITIYTNSITTLRVPCKMFKSLQPIYLLEVFLGTGCQSSNHRWYVHLSDISWTPGGRKNPVGSTYTVCNLLTILLGIMTQRLRNAEIVTTVISAFYFTKWVDGVR